MLTKAQRPVYEELVKEANKGLYPTTRSLTDRLETRFNRTRRYSDRQVYGRLRRMAANGVVARVPPKKPGGPLRWKPLPLL